MDKINELDNGTPKKEFNDMSWEEKIEMAKRSAVRIARLRELLMGEPPKAPDEHK